MDPVGPEHRHGGDEHGGVNTVEVGGFSFQLQNRDGATRMEAPTPTRGAPAALRQIPAEAPLQAALESEAKAAMLKEINEELVRYGVTGDATPRSQMGVPPAHGHADGESLDAGLFVWYKQFLAHTAIEDVEVAMVEGKVASGRQDLRPDGTVRREGGFSVVP
jgi:hypothetical protein